MKSRRASAVFQAPVDRYTTKTSRLAAMMSAYSPAMPGTGRRLLSLTRKALRKASRGRGSIVTMMVSSMSLTRPNASPGPTMRTGSSTGSASSVESRTVFQPGWRSDSRRTST
jgi:hypothetical protein